MAPDNSELKIYYAIILLILLRMFFIVFFLIILQFGPENPFRTQQMAAPRNMLSGYAEPAHINDFMFEQQRRTFATYGKVIREFKLNLIRNDVCVCIINFIF